MYVYRYNHVYSYIGIYIYMYIYSGWEAPWPYVCELMVYMDTAGYRIVLLTSTPITWYFLLRCCCSVLQCVAVCCSVLQCVAVCCSELQWVAVCCSVLQWVAVYCSVLQCVAQHTAITVGSFIQHSYTDDFILVCEMTLHPLVRWCYIRCVWLFV